MASPTAVVPMSLTPGSTRARNRIASLASCSRTGMSEAIMVGRSRISRKVSTVIWLATSPPRWPPIPSATRNTGACASTASSFRLRTRPVSVADPQVTTIMDPRPDTYHPMLFDPCTSESNGWPTRRVERGDRASRSGRGRRPAGLLDGEPTLADLDLGADRHADLGPRGARRAASLGVDQRGAVRGVAIRDPDALGIQSVGDVGLGHRELRVVELDDLRFRVALPWCRLAAQQAERPE